jgi:exopolysaccharide (amylovoran) exporter
MPAVKPQNSAAAWTVAVTLVGACAQLLQIAVAARFLTPAEFGVLAIVNVMLAVVTAFQDLGLSSYCVHLGDVPRRSHSTLFWISTALGGLGAVVVYAIATPVAGFYEMPALVPLLELLAVNFFLIGVGGQYQANYIRVFQATRLAQIELGARLVGLGVALTLLAAQWGPRAIVTGMLVFAATKLALMAAFASRDWHPGLLFDRALAPRALRYGAFQTGTQLVSQLRMQADQLIVGKALGAEMLGVYALAKDLIGYPLRFVQPLMARLTLPTLAFHQHDSGALRVEFVRGLRTTAIFCGAIYALLALLAPWVVEILYGDGFAAVAKLVPLMTLFGALRPLGQNAGLLAQATGRTRNEFTWNLRVSLVTWIPNLLIGAFAPSLMAFAIALSLIQVAVTLLAYPFFVRPLEPIGMHRYVGSWILPAGVAVLASAFAIGGVG